MGFTVRDVRHVARLARLAVSEKEAERLVSDLNAVLSYAEQLNALTTDSVLPTFHGLGRAMPLREDAVRPSFSPERVLSQAPQVKDGMFAVPRILEGDGEGGAEE
jgi:aspartyl-tRNA(Asn)/glutamyl-tRNA(Gln) amidotransferase subunit C